MHMQVAFAHCSCASSGAHDEMVEPPTAVTMICMGGGRTPSSRIRSVSRAAKKEGVAAMPSMEPGASEGSKRIVPNWPCTTQDPGPFTWSAGGE